MRADKSLKPFEIRLYRHYRVVHGVRIALAFVLTFLLVRLLNVPEGTWPLITLVVVMGPISFWGNVVPRAFQRIGGCPQGPPPVQIFSPLCHRMRHAISYAGFCHNTRLQLRLFFA